MVYAWLVNLLSAACPFCRISSTEAAERAPVILVPGLAGSALESKVNRTKPAPWLWPKKTENFRALFFSFKEACRPACLLDELQLSYDENTGRYSNQAGVEIRARDFGGLGGIDTLVPGLPSLMPMYRGLTRALKHEGYQERRDLFGAPYDFRMAADGLEQTGYYADLKQLIEHAVEINSGRLATIVAHSQGALVALYFMAKQPSEWVRKHIGSFIAISAPWAGAVSTLKGSISGDNFDIPLLPHALLRPVQATAPSGPWLFPAADQWQDKVLVATRQRKYTADELQDLLKDLNLTQQAAVYPRVRSLVWPLPRLDIPVHCLYGTGTATDEGYVYDVDCFSASVPSPPKEASKGEGDGTVNLRSLEAGAGLGESVRLKSFKGASHMGILQDRRLIGEVAGLVTGGAAGRSRAGSESSMTQHGLWGHLQQLARAKAA